MLNEVKHHFHFRNSEHKIQKAIGSEHCNQQKSEQIGVPA